MLKWNGTGLVRTGEMKDFWVKPVQDVEGTGGYYLLFSKNFSNQQAEGYDEWYPNPDDAEKRIGELNIDWVLKNTDVMFRGRKAILSCYFDAACLLFDRRIWKPKWKDLKLTDRYYPKKSFLFFMDIPCNERMQIKLPDGSDLLDCYCESFLFSQDLPKDLSEQGYIEIIGEDPFDYRTTGEGYRYNRTDVYAHTKCKRCGRKYQVHFHDGYRVTYPKWELE